MTRVPGPLAPRYASLGDRDLVLVTPVSLEAITVSAWCSLVLLRVLASSDLDH